MTEAGHGSVPSRMPAGPARGSTARMEGVGRLNPGTDHTDKGRHKEKFLKI